MDKKIENFAVGITDFIISFTNEMSERDREAFFTELFSKPNETIKKVVESYNHHYREWVGNASKPGSKEFNDILMCMYERA